MKFSFCFFLLFFVGFVMAQEAFEIKNYQVVINIDESGKLHVNEILDVFFKEKRRGLIREIPYVYKTREQQYKTPITNIKVKDHKVKVADQSGNKKLRIGDANKYLLGDQRYEISYDVGGAVVRYDDHDEFYWNVIGFESEVETNVASFSIRFPTEWADSLSQYVAYTGRNGSKTADLYLTKKGGQFSAATTKSLGAYEGITFAANLPKGLVTSSMQSFASSSSSSPAKAAPTPRPAFVNWLVGIPIAIAAFLLGLWNKVKSKTRLEKKPQDRYYPPEGFNPAEVGTFWDYTVHNRDIISLLPYWGELGVISIKPLDHSDGDMYFNKLSELPAGSTDYEYYFYSKLFEESDLVLLSDLKEKFHTSMSSTSGKIKEAVIKRPLYDPEYKRTFHSNKIVAALFILILMGILSMMLFEAFLAGAGFILLGIILFIIRASEPALSSQGKQIKNELRGLYNWLKNPETEKLDALVKKDPNYLFSVFPYAIAFGLDKTWQKSMDHMHIDPPIWYDTSGLNMSTRGYTMARLASDFQPKEIAQVFTSSPAPKGGSGGGNFSGGGFSGSAGGGMGGGSVSSW